MAQLFRRSFLRKVAGGLGLAALPKWARAYERVSAGGYQFAVVSDLHYRDSRCDAWLARVVDSIAAQRPRVRFVVLNGDLVEDGDSEQFEAVQKAFLRLAIPVHATYGNHDCDTAGTSATYLRFFGPKLNYRFELGGITYLALNSTEGRGVFRTWIPGSTLAWLDSQLVGVPANSPLIVFTHYPIGRNWLRPLNAPGLLAKFHNTRPDAILAGHWHGSTAQVAMGVPCYTSRCCSWWRGNQDGNAEKGYTLCCVHPQSTNGSVLEHSFIPLRTNG